MPATASPTLNADVDWSLFDSIEYRNHNYQRVREDDRKIVTIIRNFFAKAGVENGRGIDVGTGSNLYPALGMLPFCRSLDLVEHSPRNVAWLNQQIAEYDRNWDSFWSIYRGRDSYSRITDPRVRLRKITKVSQGSIFELRRRHWNLGTMFFVACSISTEMTEFTNAVHGFVGCLRPKAPFAAAFMTHSDGYTVGDTPFPAVAVGPAEVEESFRKVANQVQLDKIETSSPLRDNVGMIVVTGRVAD